MKLWIWLTKMTVKLLLIRCFFLCGKSVKDLLGKLFLVRFSIFDFKLFLARHEQARTILQYKIAHQRMICSHGKLYVAFTRITSRNGLKIRDRDCKYTNSMTNFLYRG